MSYLHSIRGNSRKLYLFMLKKEVNPTFKTLRKAVPSAGAQRAEAQHRGITMKIRIQFLVAVLVFNSV